MDEPIIQSTMKCNNKQHVIVDDVIAVVLASAHTHTHEVIKVDYDKDRIDKRIKRRKEMGRQA